MSNFYAYSEDLERREGFSMSFANGWEISVAFGHDADCVRDKRGAVSAEVVVFEPGNVRFDLPGSGPDGELGGLDPEQVAKWVAWTAERPTVRREFWCVVEAPRAEEVLTRRCEPATWNKTAQELVAELIDGLEPGDHLGSYHCSHEWRTL